MPKFIRPLYLVLLFLVLTGVNVYCTSVFYCAGAGDAPKSYSDTMDLLSDGMSGDSDLFGQGEPLLASASLHLSVGGLLKPAFTSATAANTASTGVHHAMGDSVTHGTNATGTCNGGATGCGYVPLLAYDEGATLINRGVGGAFSCDVADVQVFPNEISTVNDNPVYTIMAGYNDALFRGTGAYEVNTHSCNQASFSWLATPYKIAGYTGKQTGMWSNDIRYALAGALSSTQGSTLTIPITTYGGPLYAWYELIDGNGGSFTYSVDGGTPASLNTAPATAISTNLGGTRGVGLIRVPVAAGDHKIVFTVTSATSESNTVGITAVGSPYPVGSYGPPTVYAGGIIRAQADQYASATAAYNNDVIADVQLLQSDGLPVKFVDVRQYLCTTIVASVCYNSAGVSDMDLPSAGDNLHPNNAGHNDLKMAFEQVEQVSLSSDSVSTVSTVTASTSPAISTAVSSTAAVAGGGQPFVTGQSLGTLRNNYTGWAGTELTVGSTALTVSSLGRWVVSGNTGTHSVELVQASNGAVLGTVSVATSGLAPGFTYATLSAPVTLAANTSYYLLSYETSGQDQWYNADTTLTPSGVATIPNAEYSVNNGAFNAVASANASFGPVNFLYTTGATSSGGTTSGSGTSFVTGQSLGTLRNNYTGWAGTEFTVGSTALSVSRLGRWVVSGNTGTHSVELVQASNGAVVGSVSVPTSGQAAGFNYAALSTPVTLAANTSYYLLSYETSGQDQWYNADDTISTSGVATIPNAEYSVNNMVFSTVGNANTSFGPLSFLYTTSSSPSGGSQVPAAPTGLTASAGSGQVSLSWTASATASSYSVYRGLSPGGESGTAIATAVTATSYTDSGLTNGTPYYYKVTAVNSSGTSGYSNEVSATPMSIATTAGGSVAATANSFLNSLGVVIHDDQIHNDSSYTSLFQYSGIRNARGGNSQAAGQVALHNATQVAGVNPGVMFDILFSGGDSITSNIADAKIVLAAGALLAVEGPNEPNNQPFSYLGATGGGYNSWLPVAEYQRDMYAAVKADSLLGSAGANIPVFDLSEPGGEIDNVGLQFLTIPNGSGLSLPDGTRFADYANVHNYINPTADNNVWNGTSPNEPGGSDGMGAEYFGVTWNRHYNALPLGSAPIPMVTTEFGASTSSADTAKPLTQDQQGKLAVNQFCSQFKRGFQYSFWYEMRDYEGGNYGMGLFDASSNPKLAATYIHNLTTILADDTNFTPGSVSYSITNEPSTVHDLLLEKSNYTYYLIVWDDRPVGEGIDNVTVNLGANYGSVSVYDPTQSSAALQTLSNVGTLTLALTDHPLIVAFH